MFSNNTSTPVKLLCRSRGLWQDARQVNYGLPGAANPRGRMSRTKQPDYDVKPDFGTLLDKHRQLPFKRFMDIIAAKLDDLNSYLLRPAPVDQGPGRIIPYSIPVLFGPLPLTAAGRPGAITGQTGFETQAPLAKPSEYVVPRNGDILIDREFSFHCHSINAYGFVNWGYKADPGFPVPLVNASGVGDIFDSVLNDNGGAMPLDFFGGTFSCLTDSGTNPNLPNISFEIELYDRLRGRRLHDARLPSEMLQGGRLAQALRSSPMVFEKGSKLEPRLFVTEIRMGSVLDQAEAFNAASVKAWVCLVFKGTQHVEIPNR